MKFNPNQLREDALIKKGRYKFKVIIGNEKKSIAGNDILNLKLSLLINDREVTHFDTLVLTPKMFWKVEHFALATGISEKVEAGELMAQDCDNLTGYLQIDHRSNKNTGEIEVYVSDYIKRENLDPLDLQSLILESSHSEDEPF